jgi:hypothetical protein
MSIDPTRRSIVLLNGDNLDPEVSGDINARIAAMLLAQSQDRKDYLREARRAEEQHLRAVEDAEVQAIRDEAVHTRAAAQSRAIGAIVSGGFQVAGGVALGGIADKGDAKQELGRLFREQPAVPAPEGAEGGRVRDFELPELAADRARELGRGRHQKALRLLIRRLLITTRWICPVPSKMS